MRHRLQGLVITVAAVVLLPAVLAGADDSTASSPAIAGTQFAATVAPRLRMEPIRTDRTGQALWIASIAALAVANVADAKSSWGKDEGNRMLAGTAGRFGTKGIVIKGGVNAAWIAGQIMVLRKNRAHRGIAIVNFAAASIFGAIAYRNRSIASPAAGFR